MLAIPLEHATGRGQKEQLVDQLDAWQDYLAFEQSNPHQLEVSALVDLVDATFERALCVLRYFPEMWFRFSDWHIVQVGPFKLVDAPLSVFTQLQPVAVLEYRRTHVDCRLIKRSSLKIRRNIIKEHFWSCNGDVRRSPRPQLWRLPSLKWSRPTTTPRLAR